MVEPKQYFATFNQILPKLFIGNSDSAYDPKVLKLLGVSHILIMGSELQIKYPDQFIYKKIALQDSVKTNLLQYLDQGIKFIQQGIAQDGVLVHCRFGISRSSAMVIAYLMKTKKQDFWKSFYQVRHKRDYVKPNKGFVKQLIAYEQTLSLKN